MRASLVLCRGSSVLRLLADPSIIRATCVFDTKKVEFLRRTFSLSPYPKVIKKNLQFFYFCLQVSAFLIDLSPCSLPSTPIGGTKYTYLSPPN